MVITLANHFSPNFDQLSDTDQQVLTELDTYYQKQRDQVTWDGYRLEDKTILAINKPLGAAYLINPTSEINSLFAQKITMPQGSNLQVYRLSVLTPQTLIMRFGVGNFNTIGKTYSLFGNQLYYTKYSAKTSLTPQYSSDHYIAFLAHEAFHYYMQENWSGGERFSGELTENDIDLLAQEYDVLANIQTELAASKPSKELLLSYAKDYVAIMTQRIAANPQYLASELSMETAEGTAQYVGIKAAAAVGYDYGVMYFDNKKDVSFAEVIPTLKAGNIEQSFLANRMPYETGALLCELMDALSFDNWQTLLNQQTTTAPVSLYDVISSYLDF
jgi:hypothetical protein